MSTHSFTGFIPLNVAPSGAAAIGVYDPTGSRIGTMSLPESSLGRPRGTKLYSFGILSDVHQNSSSTNSEYLEDLDNALTYFGTEGVEFTCICGDLTQNAYSDTSKLSTELDIYANTLAGIADHAPVYPTTGNHDCPKTADIAIDTFKSKTGISDLFTSDATYSYEVTKTHGGVTDHFLFLGMKRYSFSSGTYSDGDIAWLGGRLEAYKRDRCFVVTHMFFPDSAGNFGRYYPTGNWLSGANLTALKALRDAYPRVIWFSGHSHWKAYLQTRQKDANVSPTTNDRTSAFTFHVSSCASPIDSNVGNPNASSTRDEAIGMAQSEGAVVDVYEDCVEIRCVEFKGEGETSYANRLVPVAQYLLPTSPDGYVVPDDGGDTGGDTGDTGDTGGDSGDAGDGMTYMTSSMVLKNSASNKGTPVNVGSADALASYTSTSGVGYYVDDETHDLHVKFTANKQGVFICSGGTPAGTSDDSVSGSDITSSDTVVIHNDGVEWSPSAPPSAALSKIGFYGGGYGATTGSTYSTESGFYGDTSKGALQFQASSSFTTNGGTFPVTVTIRNLRYKVN